MINIILILSILIFGSELPAAQSSTQNFIIQKERLSRDSADYLIITNHLFTANLEPLITFRESSGLSVKVVEDTTIYNSYLREDSCDAIKNFILDVYNNWDPRPKFILFVGDANEDDGSNNYIPSKIFPKFSYYYSGGCQTHCSDNWYVELEGDDYVPELITGRFPVESTDELDLLIQKTLEYEQSGIKIDTVMVVMSGEFESSSAPVFNTLPSTSNPVNLYGSQMSGTQCNNAIKSTYESGLDLVFGLCHGSLNRTWSGEFGSSSNAVVFQVSDFSDLPTDGVSPILFEWG